MLIIYYIHKPSGEIVRHHASREEYSSRQLEELIKVYNEKTPLYTAVAAELAEGSLELYLYKKLENVRASLKTMNSELVRTILTLEENDAKKRNT